MEINQLTFHNDEMKTKVENAVVLGKLLGYKITSDDIFGDMYLTFMKSDENYTLYWNNCDNNTISLLEFDDDDKYGYGYRTVTKVNAIEELEKSLN